MFQPYHVSSSTNRMVLDYLNGVDSDHMAYYLQLILASIEKRQELRSANVSTDPPHHYILNLLHGSDLLRMTFSEQNLSHLISTLELCFDSFEKQFSHVLNSNLMDPSAVEECNENIYQALAYFVVGYTVLIHFIPLCLSMTPASAIKEEDMETYGQLIRLYKKEFYFNGIRASIEQFTNEQRMRTSNLINNDHLFPRIKKRKLTKSYLTDYGPDFFEKDETVLPASADVEDLNPLQDTVNGVQEIDIQKDLPAITSRSLQKYLHTKDKNVLLVDLRPREDFNNNHISNKWLVNIDPHLLLLNMETATDDSFEKTLRKIFKTRIEDLEDQDDPDSVTIRNNYNYYKQRYKFNLIVYYTDARTWSYFNNDTLQFNYLQYFFDLIYKDKTTNAAKSRKLIRAPKLLEDGFEGWLALLEAQNVEASVESDYANYYAPKQETFPREEPVNLSMKPVPEIPKYEPYPVNFNSHYDRSDGYAPTNMPPPIPKKNSIRTPPPLPPKPVPKLKPRSSPVAANFTGTRQKRHSLGKHQHIHQEPPSPSYPAPAPPQQTVSPYEAAREQQSGKKRKPPAPVTLPAGHNGSQAVQAPTLQPPQQASQLLAAPRRPHVPILPLRPTAQSPQKSQNVLKQYNIVGLKNYEYNCYINSLLQCIFANSDFRFVFSSNNYKKYSVNKKPVISRAVGRLFDKMLAHGGVIIAPTNFLSVCSKMRPDFRIPYQQQDTAEFLIFLLDALHEELKGSSIITQEFPETVVPALDYRDITEFDTSLRLSINVTDEEIRGYTRWFKKVTQKTGVSPVSALFQGQLESCLKCVKCLKVLKTFANFSVLTLPIVQQSHNKKKIRLEDCIRLFTADEILSGENAWDCPTCKKKAAALAEANNLYNNCYGEGERPHFEEMAPEPQKESKGFLGIRGKKKEPKVPEPAPPPLVRDKYVSMQIMGNKTIKSLKFIQLPRVLVLSLSRFKFNKYGEQASKDTSAIIFPLVLDIKVKDRIISYRLFGFINHFGSLKSGHYTSTVNKQQQEGKRDCWCYFDDENYGVGINPGLNYNDNTITSSDVYVLFYQQIQSII